MIVALAVGLLLSMVLSVVMVVVDEDGEPIAGGGHTQTDFTGNVVDEDGKPIAGAEVNVTCGGHTQTDFTDSDGNYGVDFTGTCSAGHIVNVTATHQGRTGSSSGKIKDYHVVQIVDIDVTTPIPEFVQIVDIDVTTPIPEFTTIAIPAATILGLLFFFNHRKRKKS